MFPVMIGVAKKFGWDLVGFFLPMAFMINQVYVFYFNSKPANISCLSNQYTMWESFKFGMTQLVIIWVLLALWTQYSMPLMGFNRRLWLLTEFRLTRKPLSYTQATGARAD